MTKQERLIIYKACELVELGYPKYSCEAIARADGSFWIEDSRLASRYGQFYEMDETRHWFNQGSRILKPQRILMLLLFAEAEDDL